MWWWCRDDTASTGDRVRAARRAGALALVALSAVLEPKLLRGADLSVGATLGAQLQYSDNLSLSLSRNPGWGLSVAPAVSLARRTESNELSGSLGLSFNRYTDASLNMTDVFGSISAAQRYDRDQLGVTAQYARQSTQAAQLLQTGLNLGPGPVSTLTVAPQWTRSVTERLSSVVGASYSSANYDQTSGTNLVDYQALSASVGLKYARSERTSIGLAAAYAKYNTSPLTTRSESWSVSGNATHRASERLSWVVSLGVQRVRTVQSVQSIVCPADPVLCQLGLIPYVRTTGTTNSEQMVFPYSVSLQWQMSETEIVSALASQQVNPTGTGSVLGSNQFAASYSRTLSPTVNFVVSANYTISSLLQGANLGYYFTFSPTLRWQIDEAWSATTGYTFGRVGYPDTDQRAQANTVFVAISYGWPLLSRSY